MILISLGRFVIVVNPGSTMFKLKDNGFHICLISNSKVHDLDCRKRHLYRAPPFFRQRRPFFLFFLIMQVAAIGIGSVHHASRCHSPTISGVIFAFLTEAVEEYTSS